MADKYETTVQQFIYEDLATYGISFDDCLYCLSPETVYLAVVLLERFPDWRARWVHTDGQPVNDAEWDEVSNIVARGLGELMAGCTDLATALQTGLTAVADAIASSRGGTLNCYPGAPLADCLPNIPNEDWESPEGGTQPDPLEENPPEGFATWEEYFTYKCQAAHYIYQWLVNLCYALGGLSGLQLTSAIVVPIVAGLAGLLPAVFTPVGFVAFVGGVLAIAALSLVGIGVAIHMGNYLESHKTDIICALYNSGSAADALTALAGFIEDAIEAGILAAGLGEIVGPLVAAGLGEIFGIVQNTGLVQPLFQLVGDVIYPDATCDCGQAGDLVITQAFPPFNTILVGGPERLDGEAQSSSYGWQVTYGSSDANRWACGFTPEGNVAEVRLRFRVRAVSGSGATTVLINTYGGGSIAYNFNLGNITPEAGWYSIDETRSVSLTGSTQYELFFASEFNVTIQFNSIILQATA